MNLIGEIAEKKRGEKLLLVYNGEVTHLLMVTVLELADKNIEAAELDQKLKARLLLIFEECLENIIQNPVPLDGSLQEPLFMIERSKDYYFIQAGNPILNEEIPHLEYKLNHINSLDATGLRSLYLNLIQNIKPVEKKGAGIGLVLIARNSGQKLEFGFEKINEEYSFYTIRVKVKRSKL